MKTLILGIGNPILRDDGVGPRIIRELQGQVSDPDITFEETSLSGINLMELLTGFDSAIIVDALQSGGRPGEIRWLKPQDFKRNETPPLQHGIGLLQALELGKALDQPMPEEVDILAIEAEDVSSFGEGLTADVEKAVPAAVAQVRRAIEHRHIKTIAE
jgi:hydrogenase maturation protease